MDAVSKRQTAIYDGAEYVSIMSFLLSEDPSRFDDDDKLSEMGSVTFVCGTAEDGEEPGRRIVGIQIPEGDEGDSTEGYISLGDEVAVFLDSAATLPKGISDAVAISTAAAALCGVHCGMPRGETGKVVILGGGDYACFVAKALVELGSQVTVVTTRPMELKDTPLNPLRDTPVTEMAPTVGEDKVGFSAACGSFDSVIDTLGDEAKLGEASELSEGLTKSRDTGVAAKLKRENKCQLYISTLTKSQRFVLNEGLLYARDSVVKYQKEVEGKKYLDDSGVHSIPPPRGFGGTLQKLLDGKVVFPVDKNENGSHAKKDVFVRGWSFPDYTELEIWPQDSRDNSPVRYGFPALGELTMEAETDAVMKSWGRSKADSKTSRKKAKRQKNPFVVDIDGLQDLSEHVVESKRDCVLFVSAAYCRMCRSLDSGYTRMARAAKGEEFRDDVLFAKANTASAAGKQLAFTLQVDSVPTFLLYRDGERFGSPLGITKLPSEKLDLAIDYLRAGKEWDSEVFRDSEEEAARTKLK